MPVRLDSAREIDRLSFQVGEMIDGIAIGQQTWSNVLELIGTSLPGGFAATHNKNFAKGTINSFDTFNMDSRTLGDYVGYYSSINPWIDYWTKVPLGKVDTSERAFPSSTIAHTEFFNDWLKPQGNMDAACGLKLAADGGESVQFLVHYPVKNAPLYDLAAVRLLENIRGNLMRAIQLARRERDGVERSVGSAALLARDPDAAFVVLEDCRVILANSAAEAVLSGHAGLMVRQQRLRLLDQKADVALAAAVSAICRGIPTDIATISFAAARNRFRISLHGIGSAHPLGHGFAVVAPARRMVLLLVSEITPRRSPGFDRPGARALFGLTPAETDLCERLLDGDSLLRAADKLSITTETARTRLKAILSKTETSRQAELMLLLTRLQ